MRLGSSIRRRRFRSDGRFEWLGEKRWLRLGPLNLSRDAAVVAGTALVFGLAFGYLVTTRLLFPMPPRPQDLFEVPDVGGLDRAAALDMMARAGIRAAVTDSFSASHSVEG